MGSYKKRRSNRSGSQVAKNNILGPGASLTQRQFILYLGAGGGAAGYFLHPLIVTLLTSSSISAGTASRVATDIVGPVQEDMRALDEKVDNLAETVFFGIAETKATFSGALKGVSREILKAISIHQNAGHSSNVAKVKKQTFQGYSSNISPEVKGTILQGLPISPEFAEGNLLLNGLAPRNTSNLQEIPAFYLGGNPVVRQSSQLATPLFRETLSTSSLISNLVGLENSIRLSNELELDKFAEELAFGINSSPAISMSDPIQQLEELGNIPLAVDVSEELEVIVANNPEVVANILQDTAGTPIPTPTLLPTMIALGLKTGSKLKQQSSYMQTTNS